MTTGADHRRRGHDFGNWKPVGALSAALVFGAAQRFRSTCSSSAMPSAQVQLFAASSVVGMVPYLLTLLILTGIIGKTTPPAADGLPYDPRGAHDARARSPRDHQKYPGVLANDGVDLDLREGRSLSSWRKWRREIHVDDIVYASAPDSARSVCVAAISMRRRRTRIALELAWCISTHARVPSSRSPRTSCSPPRRSAGWCSIAER